MFSSVGIVFKGSGFYRTDSRAGASDGRQESKEKVSADSSTSSGSGDAKGSSLVGLVVEEVRLRIVVDLVVVLLLVVDQQRTRRGRVRLTPPARLSTSPSVVHRFGEHRPPVGPSP